MTANNTTLEQAQEWFRAAGAGITTSGSGSCPAPRFRPYEPEPLIILSEDKRPRCSRCKRLIPGYAAMPVRQPLEGPIVHYCSMECALEGSIQAATTEAAHVGDPPGSSCIGTSFAKEP